MCNGEKVETVAGSDTGLPKMFCLGDIAPIANDYIIEFDTK
jgi:hypothetical protein